MYFISFIRDYIELLNNVYDSVINDFTFQKIIQESFLFLLQSFKFILFYIFSFQWLRDLIYLPIIIPQISNSILKENFFLESPLQNFFHLIDFPSFNQNKFLIGFLNSFFLSLPLSCAHLIYIRRLLIQGNVAGIAAGLGTIIGQIFFISSILLGCRFIIVPWFSFEPLNYIIGIFLLINIVYEMVHERVLKIIDWNNKSVILKIFLLNFFLIWTEQSCIFQFLGNLTIGPDTTVIDIFSSTTTVNFVINHINYILGLLIGCLFFNIIFAILLKLLSEFIQLQFTLLKSTWIIRLNFVLLTSILAFSFSSIPFYGLDYLLTGPLGFISNDKAFKNTIFSQNELRDPFGILGGFSDNLSLDTDVTSFDKGFYLKAPILQTFEDLNFSGEYASTIRQGNIPLFDQYKEKARKIREIIIKKPDLDKENQQQNIQSTNQSTLNQSSQLVENQKTKLSLYDYPTYYPIDNNVYISSSIQNRFENNYKESSNLIFENILQGTLNNVFSDEKFTVAQPEIEKKLKERFYSNPVYKFLLTIDIDSFLNRQPKNFLLSSNEEHELYKKRLILSRYHDSLRLYNTLPYAKEFNYFFNGSKSFADRVYNQQFKGTLHIVRRLFSVSFISSGQSSSELSNSLRNRSNNFNEKDLILKYDQPLYKPEKKISSNLDQSITNSFLHEELKTKILNQDPNKLKLNSPFLELIGQNPLYFGWDENLRKIVLTNRLLPRSLTNFVEVENKNKTQINFTTWPIKREDIVGNQKNSISTFSSSESIEGEPVKSDIEIKENPILKNSKLLSETQYSLSQLKYNNLLPLFEYDDKESGISYYNSLPSNVTKLANGIVDVIPPNRGGFIWPGTSSLKFSIKDLLKL